MTFPFKLSSSSYPRLLCMHGNVVIHFMISEAPSATIPQLLNNANRATAGATRRPKIPTRTGPHRAGPVKKSRLLYSHGHFGRPPSGDTTINNL